MKQFFSYLNGCYIFYSFTFPNNQIRCIVKEQPNFVLFYPYLTTHLETPVYCQLKRYVLFTERRYQLIVECNLNRSVNVLRLPMGKLIKNNIIYYIYIDNVTLTFFFTLDNKNNERLTQIAFVSNWRLIHSGKAAHWVWSLLAGIWIGHQSLVLDPSFATSTHCSR